MDARFTLLLACFFLSGFAALLYQTAWTRELSFVFGTSELAVAAVLAAYMGGLALGAAAAARFALRVRRPVLVYGLLELAIALSALSVPAGIALINSLYVGLLGGGSELPDHGASWASLFQLGAAFTVLLPPTAFMGATLPLLARHAVRREEEIGSRVGMLYAINTTGAIGGTLCAAFWLMPELGLRQTVWVGAALNAIVFALAALLARGATTLTAPEDPPGAPSPTRDGAAVEPALGNGHWILPAVALSGAVSFAYEVLWTRLLGHLLGSSVQAFATMLGSFLLGIALGSALASRFSTGRSRAALGFGASQLAIALSSYGAFALSNQLPRLAQQVGASPDAPLAGAAVAAAALLPITLCIGATFPFAVRLLTRHPAEAARATARIYAWNTLGAIAGALGAGFLLLPGIGFAGTLTLGVAANLALAAWTALAMRPRRHLLAAGAVAGGISLLLIPARTPWDLLRSSPLTRQPAPGTIVYSAVGRSSTVLLFDRGSEFRLSSNGLPESRIERQGALIQSNLARWLGLLPSLLRPEVHDLLIVGLGGGMALESVPPTVREVDVIELEPEILIANQKVASQRAIDPLADPRVRVHLGDARGALQLTSKRYDAIVSQPSHPWTAGASHLYTREFFALVQSKLAANGVFVQWIGLKFVDEALLRSIVATLLDVFQHVEVYRPHAGGLLFAASDAPLGIGTAAEALQSSPDAYARFGVHRVEDLAATRVLADDGVRTLAEGAPLTTDDHNLLAARAAGLGQDSLDAKSLQKLLEDLDPLLTQIGELDASAITRRLVQHGFHERATSLASAARGASEELQLGWIELGLKRHARAARHFARALELGGDAGDARTGLILSRHAGGAPGAPDPKLVEQEPDGTLAAVISGWRHSRTGRWDAVRLLDPRLRLVEPGDALFVEASRLRIGWRLEAGGADRAAEAMAIAETLLRRRWRAQDALLRASAAISAGQPLEARASLELVSRIPPGPHAIDLARQALAISERLPGESSSALRAQLERRARGGPATP